MYRISTNLVRGWQRFYKRHGRTIVFYDDNVILRRNARSIAVVSKNFDFAKLCFVRVFRDFLYAVPPDSPEGYRVGAGTLLLFLAMFALLSCSKYKEDDAEWVVVKHPVMLFSDTTVLDLYEGNELSWRVKTAYLERWGGTDSIFVKPIFADIYDSLGNKAAFLRADSGNLNMRMTFVRAYGRVYALSPKGASVRADSLIWLRSDNKIRTDGPVRVVGETGDVLQGVGFISDSKLDDWSIRSSVTGIFQDAANRLKEEDKKLLP